MPQLDFFTLLFQFKSFFVFFLLLYFGLLFIIVPRLHLIISLRRLQILNLLNYYNFLKFITLSSFASQCAHLKSNLTLLNHLYNLFFISFLDSKLNVSNLVLSLENFDN